MTNPNPNPEPMSDAAREHRARYFVASLRRFENPASAVMVGAALVLRHPAIFARIQFDVAGGPVPEIDEAVDGIAHVWGEDPADRDDSYDIIWRQGQLLTAAVNAIKGEPPPLVSWSHHDVAELAATIKAERDDALSRLRLAEARVAELERGPVSDKTFVQQWREKQRQRAARAAEEDTRRE